MILVLFLLTLVPADGLQSQQSQTQTYRLAFYYPWFPKNWNQLGIYPYTNYHPSLGFYNSSDPTVIRTHAAEMQYANIQGAIVSWWGQGSYGDKNFARILALMDQGGPTDFVWMLYYELEGTENPSISQIPSDLSYIKANYAEAHTTSRSTASSLSSYMLMLAMTAQWRTDGSRPTRLVHTSF
jgi:hypothetical protein